MISVERDCPTAEVYYTGSDASKVIQIELVWFTEFLYSPCTEYLGKDQRHSTIVCFPEKALQN